MEKRLCRSTNDKMISGVCAGIAEYFNIDPTLVRLGFAIAVFAGFGTGILAYIVGAIVIPERIDGYETEKADDMEVYDKDGNPIDLEQHLKEKKSKNLIGFILIIAGILFIGKNFLYWLGGISGWAIAAIVMGLIIVVMASNKK